MFSNYWIARVSKEKALAFFEMYKNLGIGDHDIVSLTYHQAHGMHIDHPGKDTNSSSASIHKPQYHLRQLD